MNNDDTNEINIHGSYKKYNKVKFCGIRERLKEEKEKSDAEDNKWNNEIDETFKAEMETE